MNRRSLRPILVAFGLCSLSYATPALAQAACGTALNPIRTYATSKGSTVYFKFGFGDFTDDEKDGVRQAFTNWTNAKGANKSEITFSEGDAPAGSVQITLEVGSDYGGSGFPAGMAMNVDNKDNSVW